MIFYLTFNDTPSGIYSSQVIDVVKFLNSDLHQEVTLVAFISLRGFLNNRRKIKLELSKAIVLPMFPGVRRWRMNGVALTVLSGFKKPKAIIGRSVLATQLALQVRDKKHIFKVIYDGRGAIDAEWHEYGVIKDVKMLAEIFEHEKGSVLKSDYRIAVSDQLVRYWQEKFDYREERHVVIPCTLNKVFEGIALTEEAIEKARKALGLDRYDLVFVYSGSIAGWQSFDLLYHFIKPVLASRVNSKLLFLSDEDEQIGLLIKEFPGRILTAKVNPAQVPEYLIAADYGLLIREETVTNKVASPVKFAEYLACGLPVIISDNLGDYSEFISKFNCGYLYSQTANLQKQTMEAKVHCVGLARKMFVKQHFKSAYKALLD